jgi:DNA-binding XRE family transcriptional regulator
LVPRIKMVRVQAGLSQRQVAKLAGVSPTTISFIDRGAVPELRVQLAIAKALDATPEQLWPSTPQERSGIAA